MLNEDFEYCIEKFGPPANGEPLPADILSQYENIVPQSMLEFWKSYGTGLWLNGKFQLCRPDRYQGLLQLILANDPDFPASACCTLGFSAFGKLLVWNQKNFFLAIDLVNKVAFTRHPSPECCAFPADKEIAFGLSYVDQNSYDLYEQTDKPKLLFDRALKKLGKLSFGECYGFVPAVGLGSLGILPELKKIPSLEYFAIIAQLEPIKLRFNDIENRKIITLRNLGA